MRPPIVLLVASKWSSFVAHEHISQVVRPSEWMDSSRNGGRGGGGTKCPFHRPFSVASNDNGEPKFSSSHVEPIHQLLSSLIKFIASSARDGDMLPYSMRTAGHSVVDT